MDITFSLYLCYTIQLYRFCERMLPLGAIRAMSKKTVIASDSTCDLSPELIEAYGIHILPLGVALGEKQYTDGVDIDPDFIYAHYEKTGQLPKTAAVNIAAFSDFFGLSFASFFALPGSFD